MAYAIWSKTSGTTAYSFTSTYDDTTEVMGSTSLANGGSVILSDQNNSTVDVTQTVLGLGGSILVQNGIIGDAPDSGDDSSSMVVALSGGGYAIAWVSTPTGEEASNLYLALYNNSGVQIGSDIQIDTGHTTGVISLNGIATHTSGLISVLWSDGSSGTSYESILGEGDAPVAQSFSASLDEDTHYTFSAGDFLFFDATDSVATSVKITELPTTGSLKLDDVAVTDEQVIALDDISKLVWTPDANANGNGADILYFKVSDSDGNFSQEAGVTFNIAAVADNPVTGNVHYDVNQRDSFSFSASDFTFSDADGDTLKYVIITSVAKAGSLTFRGDEVAAGDKIAAGQSSKLVYTAPTNNSGDNLASYGFQLEDSAGDLSLARKITIDVNAVNTAPVAKDDAVTAYVGQSLKIDVLGNDTDKDGDSLAITKAVLGWGAPGEVEIKNGQLVYDSGVVKSFAHGVRKSFDITYTVSDGTDIDKATVSVTLQHKEDVFGTNSADHIGGLAKGSYCYGLGGDDVIKTDYEKVYISGGDGDDRIIYSNGFGMVRAGNGNDYVLLNMESSIVYGDDGEDTIIGCFSNDCLYGGRDNDKIDGDYNDDLIDGEQGNDILKGGDGNDDISGGIGDDVIDGDWGDDGIDGGQGNDILKGGAGNDKIYGGLGDDKIYGEQGINKLFVGQGNDIVYGNDDGVDTFVFQLGTGATTIKDHYSERDGILDKFDVRAFSEINSFEELKISTDRDTGDLIVHLDRDSTIVFTNLVGDLSESDFIFYR